MLGDALLCSLIECIDGGASVQAASPFLSARRLLELDEKRPSFSRADVLTCMGLRGHPSCAAGFRFSLNYASVAQGKLASERRKHHHQGIGMSPLQIERKWAACADVKRSSQADRGAKPQLVAWHRCSYSVRPRQATP